MLLNSQLKDIYIDADLDIVDTTQWYPKVMRKDFTIGAVPIETGVDDPDQMFYREFRLRRRCAITPAIATPKSTSWSMRNRWKATPTSASTIVWQIEKKLADAAMRPVLFYPVGASCMQPYVHGLTIMVNSIYNGWRMEDVWMDK